MKVVSLKYYRIQKAIKYYIGSSTHMMSSYYTTLKILGDILNTNIYDLQINFNTIDGEKISIICFLQTANGILEIKL